MKSTSIHSLNINRKRNKIRKLLWNVLNRANNSFLPNRTRNVIIRHFMPQLTEDDWKEIYKESSPSRSLSDLFWLKLDWESIQRELEEIHIFDVGCGSGNYALRLQKFSHNRLSSYYGVDCVTKERWIKLTSQYDFITLKQLNSTDIYRAIPDNTTLFMSQSALEHFEEDMVYFQQVKRYIAETHRDVIQIHLFPSRIHLRLSPFHGVRQYFPRTISKIIRLFDTESSYALLFNLGGKYCNDLHDQFITQPLWKSKPKFDRRKTEPELYGKLLREAVERDIKEGQFEEPHFYALIIHSHYKKPIFHSMESLRTR